MNRPRVYLDSCILIYLHEGERSIREQVVKYLRPAQGPAPQLCVSDLVRLECRIRPLRESQDDLLRAYETFFQLPEVETLPLSAQVFDRATELRALHRLRTPDALHLAAAELGECSALWTNDRALRKAELSLSIEIID